MGAAVARPGERPSGREPRGTEGPSGSRRRSRRRRRCEGVGRPERSGGRPTRLGRR